MICVRCAYCCIYYSVVIINPESLKNSKVLSGLNSFKFFETGEITEHLTYKPSNQVCPHLKHNGVDYYCVLHGYIWYPKTPCFTYTQIGRLNDVCRIGNYVRDHADAEKIRIDIDLKFNDFNKSNNTNKPKNMEEK